MKINLHANVYGQSGYNIHGRCLATALHELGHEVYLDTARPLGTEVLASDAELVMMQRTEYKDGVNVMIYQPPDWPLGMREPGKLFAGFCVWEGDKIPDSWVQLMWNCDKVLVPSEHTKKAIVDTIIKVEDLDKDKEWEFKKGSGNELISIVPHGVDPTLFKSQPKPPIFTFICNKGWAKGWRDRGGIQYIMKAFFEEFNPEDNVRLYCKINSAYNQPSWNLQEEMKKIGVEGPMAERIVVDTRNLAYKDMPATYAGHCFVTASMADAFNIPVLEAMASGLPIIATDFGGHTDFAKKEFTRLVKTSPIENEWEVAYEGISWGEPDLADLRKAMREAYKSVDLDSQGKFARQEAKKWTWQMSARKLVKALQS